MVHEFKDGKDDLSEQDEVFRGRTAVFTDQVIVGNASLRLRNVQLADAGTYKCYIITSKGKGNANLEYKTGGKLIFRRRDRKYQKLLETKDQGLLIKSMLYS